MKVLFVDDEPMILRATRRALYGRPGWESHFAESGALALRMLEEATVDVLVCDMHMPGMHGSELLRTVHTTAPQCLRIVLSAQTEDDAALKIAGLAHQFVAKPCSIEELAELIEKTHGARHWVADKTVRAAIGAVEYLPSPPLLTQRIESALSGESPDVAAATVMASGDVGFAAKVMQLANSAFFARARNITSVREAMAHLGADVLVGLVGPAATARNSTAAGNTSRLPRMQTARVGQHSIAVARIAESLAAESGTASTAYTIGLLHDVGKLVPLMGALSSTDSEHDVPWAGIGGYLLALWGLPREIVEAVAYQAAPEHIENPATRQLAATLKLAKEVATGTKHQELQGT